MNDGAAAPQARMIGIAAIVVLAGLAMLTPRAASYALDTARPLPLSPMLCAVLIGLLWRNLLGVSPQWWPGVQFASQSLLRVGIALVGLKLTLAGIGNSIFIALPVVIACIGTALGVSLMVGRALGVSQPLALLFAAGTAICGCTAVVATAPVVRAQPGETGVALTCVVVIGCTGMLLYPWIANALFAADPYAAAVFLGTSIHDTSQVLAAAQIYAQQFGAEEVVPTAAFTKLLRNLSLLLLLPLFAVLARGPGNAAAATASAGQSEAPRVLPTFLIWFVALAALRLAGDAFSAVNQSAWWAPALSGGSLLSELLMVCGMTAVGLGVSVADMRGVGVSAVVTAVAVAVAVALCSLLTTTLLI